MTTTHCALNLHEVWVVLALARLRPSITLCIEILAYNFGVISWRTCEWRRRRGAKTAALLALSLHEIRIVLALACLRPRCTFHIQVLTRRYDVLSCEAFF
jgi:hypothetical protein